MKLKFNGFLRKRSLTAGFLTFWQIIVSLRLTFTIYHCTVAKQNCRLKKLRKSISNYIENTTSFFSFWEKNIQKRFFFSKPYFFPTKDRPLILLPKLLTTFDRHQKIRTPSRVRSRDYVQGVSKQFFIIKPKLQGNYCP